MKPNKVRKVIKKKCVSKDKPVPCDEVVVKPPVPEVDSDHCAILGYD